MHAAKSSDPPVAISGHLVQFNLSPKGAPEGLVIGSAKGGVVQVNFDPELVGQITAGVAQGDAVSLEVLPFPDAHPDAHPVFELVRLTTKSGVDVVARGTSEADVTVRGKVVRLNHARRGEVNGALLDTGDFVHLRPHGARAVGLEIGQKIEATGEVRGGWSGHRVIEARTANGIDIGKPPKPGDPKKAPGPKGPKHGPPHKQGHPPHTADEFRDPRCAVVSK
jgi:hypothetical protein